MALWTWLPVLILWVAGSGPARASGEMRWVDSLRSSMSLRQKIGQLIMVPVYAQADTPDAKVLQALSRDGVGGLIWMKGNGHNLKALLPRYRQESAHPLWMAMDAEWGAAMRLEDQARYPYAVTMGACKDTVLVEELAWHMGRELRELGMHVSFGPVADVNSNPFNPVIGFRSFGESPLRVASMARAYARGLERAGIMACAKHFPGHGDTELDSHHDLPYLAKDSSDLEQTELRPFRELLEVPSMMSAHVVSEALDGGWSLPVSLNPHALEGVLRRDWGYQGLVFSDALNMKGATQCYPPGELEWRALLAGNDVLLYVLDPEAAINRIELALNTGEWTEKELDLKVNRVLCAKYRYALRGPAKANQDIQVAASLGKERDMLLQKCYSRAVSCLLPDGDTVTPQASTRKQGRTLYLALGGQGMPGYQTFGLYADADYRAFSLKRSDSAESIRLRMLEEELLRNYGSVVVAWHVPSQRISVAWGMDSLKLGWFRGMLQRFKAGGGSLTYLLFGNPMSLASIGVDAPVVCAYEDHPMAVKAGIQALFGAMPAEGNLPNTLRRERTGPSIYKDMGRFGIDMQWQPRLDGRYSVSEACIRRADSMVEAVRATGAFPGAQVLVAKGEEIVWSKAFGSTDLSGQIPVDMGTLYDLASLTKVLSPALAAMALHSQEPLPLKAKLQEGLPSLRAHPLGQRRWRSVLAHQAGLVPHLAMDQVLAQDKELALRWSACQGRTAVLEDSILSRILAQPLGPEGRYVYSDLGILLADRWLQQLSLQRYGEGYRTRLEREWYRPCGATRLGYRPLERFPQHRIAPTEHDTLWRGKVVHGEVHDPMAALLGGVAPHAGLFGTASDVARVLMPLVTGYFPGRARVDSATLALFTSMVFPGNRRGLFWDRPVPGSYQALAPRSFGHSGFTGTYCWADPASGLILVFLSNRIHPHASPNLLAQSNLRTNLWELFHREVTGRTFVD